MIVIKKITVKYSAEEDRLCFAVELPNGDALLLWMTARLAVRLVGCLVGKLAPQASAEPLTRNDPQVVAKQQAIQQWEQSAANLARKPSPAVNVQPTARQLLIRSVDVGDVGQGFGLVFRWAKDDGAQAIFTAVEMRQFLQIIHSLFKEAGWPMEVWPDWYDQQKASPEKPQPMHLH